MERQFRSESCFIGVLGYPGIALVDEVGSDFAKSIWFLLLMFLCLTKKVYYVSVGGLKL
jgi:hypothetical protein